MHRNFGVHRNLLGEELCRYWHANDNEPESRWPFWVAGAAVVIMVAVAIFA